MDFIDFLAIGFASVYIAFMLVDLATDCAQKVWDRTKTTLDYLDFVEACHIPSTTNVEAIIIMVGATIRAFLYWPLFLYETWHLTKAERAEIRAHQAGWVARKDILGCVAVMLSGYPERATALFFYEHDQQCNKYYEAMARDNEALESPRI